MASILTRFGSPGLRANGKLKKLRERRCFNKPNKTEFVRVHPEMHFDTMLLDLKEDRESYLVSPSSWLTCPALLSRCR